MEIGTKIWRVEAYVREVMEGAWVRQAFRNAHDLQHVERVRRWAVTITEEEEYEPLELLEAAALLHDVGLSRVEDRRKHAAVGAEMAAAFLREAQLFTDEEIADIAKAIRCHTLLAGGGKLGELLRDADMLDLFGAVGLMRAFTSKHDKSEYDPLNVKSDTWGATANDFTERFADGRGMGPTIVDQANFQISCYKNLSTATAQRLAKPLVDFMRAYLIQLEAEITQNR